jgi:predicted nucleotidyltransferase component of viral defense system
MTNHSIKNISASVLARLKNLSKEKERPFQEVLLYYGMERFLFRLASSQYREHFILKGALLFSVWKIDDFRATVDIDMLAHTENSIENLTGIVQKICRIDFSALDGVVFDASTVSGMVMQEDKKYSGIRLRFQGSINKTKIPVQIDFGFGDVVTPSPEEIDYPRMLEIPGPKLRGYPVETVIAEKIETMFSKGETNSRLKDYYDIWILSRWRTFFPGTIRNAVVRTFEKRGGTFILDEMLDQLRDFGSSESRLVLWNQFCNKNELEGSRSISLSDLCGEIAGFLGREMS